MLTDDFTIILRLLFVQQHKKNVYQNIKSTFDFPMGEDMGPQFYDQSQSKKLL